MGVILLVSLVLGMQSKSRISGSGKLSAKQFNIMRTKETEIKNNQLTYQRSPPVLIMLCFSKEIASQPRSGSTLHHLSFCKDKGSLNSCHGIRNLTPTGNTPRSVSESPFAFRYPRSRSLQSLSVASGGIDK